MLLDLSVQKCAFHTVGVPVINYGDVQNVWIFKQQKLIDHLLTNAKQIFGAIF